MQKKNRGKLKKKRNKKGESWKKMKKYKKRKRKRNALWITIHSDFGCGETVISPHHLVS
jgi:hypothetical protein